jgi:hypothetical protein
MNPVGPMALPMMANARTTRNVANRVVTRAHPAGVALRLSMHRPIGATVVCRSLPIAPLKATGWVRIPWSSGGSGSTMGER